MRRFTCVWIGVLIGGAVLSGCVGVREPAPPTGPFRLVYDGPRPAAHAALLGALDAASFAVVHVDADLGLVRTAPRPLLPAEQAPGAPGAVAPDTAQVWLRLARHPDGRTVLAARPLLRLFVLCDPQDSTSARVPLLADLPADHLLARHILGQLLGAGFTFVPSSTTGDGLDLSTEVYDDQL